MFSFSYLYICFFIFVCKTTLISIYLIKGTVLWRALWGVNTSPHVIDSRIFEFGSETFLFGFSMVFHNKLWWRLQSQFKYLLKITFWSPSRDSGYDKLH